MSRALVLVVLLPVLARADEAPHLARIDPPAARVSVQTAIETGVQFLVKNQNKNGSFGRRTVGRNYELWCHVPGGHQAFQAATTGLCYMGMNGASYQPPESRKAQAKTLAWLVKNARVKRPFPEQFYNVWAFGYGLRALCQALRNDAEGASEKEIRATANAIVKACEIYQSPDGGWGYLDFKVPAYKPSWSTPFTTATIMIALHEAKQVDIEVPDSMIQKAVRLMHRFRTPDGNYVYSIDWKWRPKGLINRPQGSLMRNPGSNLSLYFDDPAFMTQKKLRHSMEDMVKYHRFAIAGLRRPRPHESWYAVSGYFYLYGHQYAAMVLEHMSKEDQKRFWPTVVRGTLKTRQLDGSYWDYPTYGYHKFYGTGYALMIMNRCPPEIAATLTPKKR
ncbi:MAG: hypothetical protein O7E54_08410 [Planctomycetota bacterium]|nr:hypothetical protein [Planctomycetota bacterium]